MITNKPLRYNTCFTYIRQESVFQWLPFVDMSKVRKHGNVFICFFLQFHDNSKRFCQPTMCYGSVDWAWFVHIDRRVECIATRKQPFKFIIHSSCLEGKIKGNNISETKTNAEQVNMCS